MNLSTRFAALILVSLTATACNDNTLEIKPEAPTAIITGDATAVPLDVVMFDGKASYSEQSEIVSWSWSLTKRPGGSNFPLVVDPSDPRVVTFRVDLAGDYEISLTIEDDRGMEDTDRFSFSAVPWQKVHVELTWNTPETDLDLHFVSESDGGDFSTEPFDCFFRNTNPDWGVAGVTTDDPSIDIDDVDGFGPENANLNGPLDGHRYRILVHYYADRGLGASNASVRIYLSGALRYEGIRPLDRTGAGWDVATIDWPSGDIGIVDSSFFQAP